MNTSKRATAKAAKNNQRDADFSSDEEEFDHSADPDFKPDIKPPKYPTYPAKPDSNEQARVFYKRKPYYLGKFQSPRSYAMLALFVKHLDETGEPPETKHLKPVVTSVLNHQPWKPPRTVNSVWFIAVLILGLTANAATMYFGFQHFANHKPTEIDGVVMSEREVERVRASRKVKTWDVRTAKEAAQREVMIREFLIEISQYESKEALNEYFKLNSLQRKALHDELYDGKRFDSD